MRSASLAAPSSSRDLASTRAAARGPDSNALAGCGCDVLTGCWAKLAWQTKKQARKERATPSPRYFLEVLILKDFESSEFGSADSKGVTGTFFGSADSIFGSAYSKGLSLSKRRNMTYYTR